MSELVKECHHGRLTRQCRECDMEKEICELQDKLTTITKQRNELLECLCDISNMCIGEIAMGHSLDANAIGQMIFDVTCLNNTDLNKILSTIKEQKDAE